VIVENLEFNMLVQLNCRFQYYLTEALFSILCLRSPFKLQQQSISPNPLPKEVGVIDVGEKK
jgi:hypothetical protein